MSKEVRLRPMLGAKTTPEILRQKFRPGGFASDKLDGIRALVVAGEVVSRQLKPIPNEHVQKLFGKDEYNGLDGELIVGKPNDPNVFRKTSSGVRSHSGTPDVKFHVFDWIDFTDKTLPFFKRMRYEEEFRGHEHIVPVHQFVIHSLDHLLRSHEKAVENGFEGLIYRSADHAYKFGRSTVNEGGMLKIKHFHDSEAAIIGVEELYSNQNEATISKLGLTERSSHQANKVPMDTLGALVVEDLVTKVRFKIGSGFTMAERDNLWDRREQLPGQIVTYTSFAAGNYDKPRFPIFKGFRNPH